MDWNLKITDMAGATPEHSSVIVNFVAAVRYQLKNSTCYVYSNNVQYRFKDAEGNNKIVIPDASINCRTKSRRGNMPHALLWKFYLHQPKNMIVQKRWNYMRNRR